MIYYPPDTKLLIARLLHGSRDQSTAWQESREGDEVNAEASARGTNREHDRVVLTAPVPNERLEIGDVGTVVHVYPDGKAFEIEFMTVDGQTAAGRR